MPTFVSFLEVRLPLLTQYHRVRVEIGIFQVQALVQLSWLHFHAFFTSLASFELNVRHLRAAISKQSLKLLVCFASTSPLQKN